MKAQRIFYHKELMFDGVIEMVIWQLPEPTEERPHGLKYRLVCVVGDVRVVGYDNETGKGDHKHLAGRELPYRFVDADTLVADIDCERRVSTLCHSLPSGERWRGGTDKAAATLRSGAGTKSVMRM